MQQFIDFDLIEERGPQEYRGIVEVSAADLEREEVAQHGEVRIDARGEKGNGPGEYVVEGSVEYTADMACSRCLEPFPIANRSSFTVRYRPRPTDRSSEEEIEIDARDLDLDYYAERKIPLAQIAVEQIQLTIPMKPLCDDACRGLCPQCGANRNRDECGCEDSLIDERWGALRGIRDELKKKKDV
ncbi:MAG TPA: DUF177 domain-containing protein [Thermoanaerobaculia bacterium]